MHGGSRGEVVGFEADLLFKDLSSEHTYAIEAPMDWIRVELIRDGFLEEDEIRPS